MRTMKTDPKPAARTLKTAAAAVVVLLHLVALFDAEGLKIWAERMRDPTAQSILLPPLEAWYDFSRTIGAASVRSFVRDALFSPVREASWPDGFPVEDVRPAAAASPSPSPSGSPPPASSPSPQVAPSPSPPESAAEAAAAVSPSPSPSAQPSPAASADRAAANNMITVSPDRPLDVLVLGDSLAGTALPAMLNQAVAGNRSVRVTYETHSASSIAWPVFFDWPVEIKRVFQARLKARGRPFDLAVVVLGSNDAQAIRSEGRVYQFGTDGWKRIFRARATEFMTNLAAGCGRVYWCGVPPMRKEGYRDRMVALNGIYRDLAAGFPSIRYLPLDFLGDERARYAQTKVIGKVEREIRAADGVHLSYAGAELVANRLLGLVANDFIFTRPGDKPGSK
ncbi:MAG: DUF459 domain-containing protein [Spirochaetales bacterium]|nr:DUF459 domain-containing protein [Spirochaetales bacterium]